MKSIILLTFLAVLSGCSCSSGIESTDENGEVKTQFNELCDDILYMIVSHLKLEDLASFVQVDSRFLDIGGWGMQRRYGDHMKVVIDAYMYQSSVIYDDRNDLTIHNVTMASNMLKAFGKYFQSIVLVYRHTAKVNDSDNIIDYLGKYCSKSLKVLHLRGFSMQLFEKITKPMEAVEELRLNFEVTRFSETIRLNEIFPQLRHLTLMPRDRGNFSFINSEFSQLEYFELYPTDHTDNTNNENIKELIRKNPTIRSLHVHLPDPVFVKFISQHLPSIENLKVTDPGNEPVLFDNLKDLNFKSLKIDSIGNLTMPRLESLEILYNYNPDHLNKWMEFFKNHTKLRRLIVGAAIASGETPIQVDLFTADLPNLTDVEFHTSINMYNVNFIIAFIENHSKLNRCMFQFHKFSNGDKQILSERLGNEWNFDFDLNVFKRKHPVLE